MNAHQARAAARAPGNAWVRSVASVGLAAVALLAVVASPALGQRPPAAAPEATAVPAPCAVRLAKTAAPERIALGETARVTLVVTATCAAPGHPLHLVLVIDGSHAAGEARPDIKDHLRELVTHLDLENNPGIRIGVVESHNTPTVTCQLTDDDQAVTRCIDRLRFEGSSQFDLAIDEAAKVLTRGHAYYGGDPDDIKEVMLVMMASGSPTGCAPVLRAASGVKQNGVLVISVCASATCDDHCTASVASSPRYTFELDDWPALLATLDQILDSDVDVSPLTATITDTLPANMALVPGSDLPPAVVSGRQLVWADLPLPAAVTVSFVVAPLEVGRHATNDQAEARVIFSDHTVVNGTFPIPFVEVVPPPSPTSTATEPPPPTPSPTPTTTPGPGLRALLPWAERR